ncbi:hypothetical protein F66182_3355 [Fusarium sp. NRRL 66182]|nr:hypothetical protein F66182_3355 [Fusarium sp. NRRL 66182]
MSRQTSISIPSEKAMPAISHESPPTNKRKRGQNLFAPNQDLVTSQGKFAIVYEFSNWFQGAPEEALSETSEPKAKAPRAASDRPSSSEDVVASAAHGAPALVAQYTPGSSSPIDRRAVVSQWLDSLPDSCVQETNQEDSSGSLTIKDDDIQPIDFDLASSQATMGIDSQTSEDSWSERPLFRSNMSWICRALVDTPAGSPIDLHSRYIDTRISSATCSTVSEPFSEDFRFNTDTFM